jgi:hypothetical protein
MTIKYKLHEELEDIKWAIISRNSTGRQYNDRKKEKIQRQILIYILYSEKYLLNIFIINIFFFLYNFMYSYILLFFSLSILFSYSWRNLS